TGWKGCGKWVGGKEIQQRGPNLPHDEGRRQSLGPQPPQCHRKESWLDPELRLLQRHERRGLCMGQGEARSLHRETRRGRARQQHEAVWRAHIGRGPCQGDCVLGIAHYQLSGYVTFPIPENGHSPHNSARATSVVCSGHLEKWKKLERCGRARVVDNRPERRLKSQGTGHLTDYDPTERTLHMADTSSSGG